VGELGPIYSYKANPYMVQIHTGQIHEFALDNDKNVPRKTPEAQTAIPTKGRESTPAIPSNRESTFHE